MTRLLVSALAALGLLLLLFSPRPQAAEALPGDWYAVLFQASVRGYDYDGDGELEWCNTRWNNGQSGYHGSDNAIDEQDRRSSSCYGDGLTGVDVATWGLTTGTQSASQYALDGVFYDGELPSPSFCDYIYVDFYGHSDGRYRGRQRLLHSDSLYPNGTWLWIYAGLNQTWRSSWWGVGLLTEDTNCKNPNGTPGWTGFHVHQGQSTSCNYTLNQSGLGELVNEKWPHADRIHRWTWTEGYACPS